MTADRAKGDGVAAWIEMVVDDRMPPGTIALVSDKDRVVLQLPDEAHGDQAG